MTSRFRESVGMSIVTAAGVAAGNRIIVTFAMDSGSGAVSCSDSKGNSSSVDVDHSGGGSGTAARTVI